MNIIISDLDGTLLNCNEISEKNLHAIENWIKRGNVFSIATGRPLDDVKKNINIACFNYPVITNNGNLIYNFKNNSVLYKKSLSNICIENLLNKVKNYSEPVNMILYGKDRSYIYSKDSLFITKHEKKMLYYVINQDFQYFKDNILNILVQSTPEIMKEIYMYCIENDEVDALYHENRLVDIYPEGISKGEAILELLCVENFEKIYVIGDDYNDMTMFQEKFIKVAVGNAVEELKKKADLIVADYMSDAVYDLINKIM